MHNANNDNGDEIDGLPDVNEDGISQGVVVDIGSDNDSDVHLDPPNRGTAFRVWVDGSITLEVGQMFIGGSHFREIIKDYSIQKGFKLKINMNERKMITYKCKAKGCPHICLSVTKNRDANSVWLGKKFEAFIKENLDANIKVLGSVVLRQNGTNVPNCTLYKAKRYALKIRDDDHKQIYNKLYKVYPIALGVVETESLDSWRRFFELLYRHVGVYESRKVCFMTDRPRGNILALSEVWPNYNSRFRVKRRRAGRPRLSRRKRPNINCFATSQEEESWNAKAVGTSTALPYLKKFQKEREMCSTHPKLDSIYVGLAAVASRNVGAVSEHGGNAINHSRSVTTIYFDGSSTCAAGTITRDNIHLLGNVVINFRILVEKNYMSFFSFQFGIGLDMYSEGYEIESRYSGTSLTRGVKVPGRRYILDGSQTGVAVLGCQTGSVESLDVEVDWVLVFNLDKVFTNL
ncbi:hypothetical protein Ddye_030139 [Dipteronia dyeriana]|uniref:Transposase MuDR plant domain-containing protein n=1 Tax=Dipteronia dyeriana TaxID=168575 RepID=A0AAD9TFX0_9ROSI|nr:hypothetical protein Ddye_030139 [Dipteronia dyeriana]